MTTEESRFFGTPTATILKHASHHLPDGFQATADVPSSSAPAPDFIVCRGPLVWSVWLGPGGHEMDDGPDLDMWRITRGRAIVGGDVCTDYPSAGASIASAIVADEATVAGRPARDALRKRLRASVQRRLLEPNAEKT